MNMEIFVSKRTKGIKSHLANLVAIAKMDGNFSLSEKRLIFEIGLKNGLSLEQVKDIIKSEEPIEFKVPNTDSDRFDRVYDLVRMAMADGHVTEEELEAAIELAQKLGFRKAICGVLVRKIMMGIKSNVSEDILKLKCGDFLVY